jgi:hypothetical protein
MCYFKIDWLYTVHTGVTDAVRNRLDGWSPKNTSLHSVAVKASDMKYNGSCELGCWSMYCQMQRVTNIYGY